ncbi:hypothetical protein [uncultured Muribaculum sp.]|mgnify:FL=1|uniref:hypothetical protein n=1 Tax=uncultured Muribaculum sp. TaxID=1918613 RepID=UPI0025B0314E|nr:hypothetical protein [uncultured Muribaculum sp.]
MKRLTLIAAVGVAACLFSCRTQKVMTSTDQNSTLSYADTTKMVADTTSRKQTDTDTTKTAITYEGVGIMEFVEGGGKVSIDSAGNVTFEGVKNIKGQHKECMAQDKGVTRKAGETAGHREQLNGVRADQAKQVKQTEEKGSTQKWYETVFARIGLGVCIAALMWLLFLYIKRKF